MLAVAFISAAFAVYMHYNHRVKTVSEIPPGFISLDIAIAAEAEKLEYVFFESQIAFLNLQGDCVYQTNVHNSDFIVQYKNEYYVDENEYNKFACR